MKSGKFPKETWKIFTAVAVIVFIISAAFIAYRAGWEISIGAIYMLPIFIAAWYLGAAAGLLTALLCSCVMIFLDCGAAMHLSNLSIRLWNDASLLILFIVFVYLLIKYKKSYYLEKSLADTDFLTKILNRRGFFDVLTAEIERAARYRHVFTVAFVDIDGFKRINDTRGHEEGDRLLVDFAGFMKKHIRKSDFIGRLGGDEFVILFPETGAKAGSAIISKLSALFSGSIIMKKYPVTFSAGLAAYLMPPVNAEEVIRKCDRLMYLAKKSRKNRIKMKLIR